MGKKLADLIKSNSKPARLVRSIDPHIVSDTGEDDFEQRRNVYTTQGDT